MSNPKLPIFDMSQRHIGLTSTVAEYWTEGARVCLDRHHLPPVDFQINWAERQMDASVAWQPTDDHTKDAWANETDTTEAGAYACILAAVELMDGLVAIRRAETETGADYYIAPPGTSPDDWEDLIRLEVSGTDRGSAVTVSARLTSKLRQAASGDSDLPAIAGVVGFQARLIRLANLEE